MTVFVTIALYITTTEMVHLHCTASVTQRMSTAAQLINGEQAKRKKKRKHERAGEHMRQ